MLGTVFYLNHLVLFLYNLYEACTFIVFILQRRKLNLREVTEYAQASQLVSCRVKIQNIVL